MNECWIGIDPGMNGGIAFLMSGFCCSYPVPISGDEIDVNRMIRIIIDRSPNLRQQTIVCCIEKVGAMPGQGVTSMFKFGFVTGMLHGIIRAMDIPLFLVTPQAWKKEILAGTDKSKQAAIDYVTRAYPGINLLATPKSRKPHDGMAESICIAEYCKRKYPTLDW